MSARFRCFVASIAIYLFKISGYESLLIIYECRQIICIYSALRTLKGIPGNKSSTYERTVRHSYVEMQQTSSQRSRKVKACTACRQQKASSNSGFSSCPVLISSQLKCDAPGRSISALQSLHCYGAILPYIQSF